MDIEYLPTLNLVGWYIYMYMSNKPSKPKYPNCVLIYRNDFVLFQLTNDRYIEKIFQLLYNKIKIYITFNRDGKKTI